MALPLFTRFYAQWKNGESGNTAISAEVMQNYDDYLANLASQLGDAATHPASDFDPAGSAATVAANVASNYLPRWQPNTAYTAGQSVVNPTGDVVTALANFTSGTTYNAANWALSSSYAPRSIPAGAVACYALVDATGTTLYDANGNVL